MAATPDVVIDGIEQEAHQVARIGGRRDISPAAGRALEILGHAIEYLADEYVHQGKEFSAQDPQVKAVQLLMALNRQIYYSCPVKPTLIERLRAFFRASAH